MGLFDRIKKVWSQDMAIDLGAANTLVVVKGLGVVLFDDSNIATEEMLKAQAEVFLRIPANKNINFLSDKDCDEILNLESEKYRKKLFV